ncbi:hypothetical protein BESB_020320 [Besnoitia besnoiti]|uniref:Uncharacterized protein n=1 Tax=Besnoitia besnoiti TaxID=94643 RepID=A0A2A9M713_BESBE|nr:hypothetical protein BESB_020320 [Besnoitia besnoiti]PFH32091.1 hypothetical protein BESB_020320 [Besnoitia besnoiti]
MATPAAGADPRGEQAGEYPRVAPLSSSQSSGPAPSAPPAGAPLAPAASTWLVAAVVLLLTLPVGTLLDGLFLTPGARTPGGAPLSGASPGLWDRLFTPDNPLPSNLADFLSYQLQHLPGFHIVAVDYQPALFFRALGKLLDVLCWASLALVVFIRPICAFFGWTAPVAERRAGEQPRLPDWAEALETNRVTAIISAFFGAQVLRSLLIPSNAFEIHFGQNLLWSTLQNGRMPNGRDILRGLEALGVRVADPM